MEVVLGCPIAPGGAGRHPGEGMATAMGSPLLALLTCLWWACVSSGAHFAVMLLLSQASSPRFAKPRRQNMGSTPARPRVPLTALPAGFSPHQSLLLMVLLTPHLLLATPPTPPLLLSPGRGLATQTLLRASPKLRGLVPGAAGWGHLRCWGTTRTRWFRGQCGR